MIAFLLKINVEFPGEEDLLAILERTSGAPQPALEPVLGRPSIEGNSIVGRGNSGGSWGCTLRRACLTSHAPDRRRRPGPHRAGSYATDRARAGPQALLGAARVRCLMDGRLSPSVDDVRAVAPAALRHRVILNFEGEAEGIREDDCIDQVLAQVKVDE